METSIDHQVGVLYPTKQVNKIRATFYNTLIQRLFHVLPIDLKGNNTRFAENVFDLRYMDCLFIFENNGFLDKLSTDYVLSANQRRVPVHVIRFKRTTLTTTVKVYTVKAIKFRDKTNLLQYSYISEVKELEPHICDYNKLLLN